MQEDPAFYALMANLFNCGCGIYRFVEIDAAEVEEIIEHTVRQHRAVLGSVPEARQRVSEFLAEVQRTRAAFPGIEQRVAMLEKCSQELEDALKRELSEARTDAAEITGRLMFGDKSFAPDLAEPVGTMLGLVSHAFVREGAAVLQRLQPEVLFPSVGDWAEWCQDNYQRWRNVYYAAAEQGEELLVGVS
jgi:hypothetical protein